MRVPLPIRIFPALTWRAWLTPPPISDKTISRDRESTADLTSFLAGDIAGHEVGSGPLALALHGWGGRPAQMAPVARRLADEGYRVVIPELPGHGGGPATDILQAASAIRRLIDEVGEPEIVLAHSFASMVMRVAFPETGPRQAVLFAPALDVRDALDVFGDRLRLFPWARRGLRRRLKGFVPELWERMTSLPTDHMPGTEILLVHDPGDQDTPFTRSAEFAALRPATILAVEGVGHSRILSDPEVLDRVASFAGARVG